LQLRRIRPGKWRQIRRSEEEEMIQDVLTVVLNMLAGIFAAAILVFGFAFLIFLGDANARDKPLVSGGFDKFAMLTIYLSWFSPLWWFGFSNTLLMVACGATVMLCLVYAASYHAATSRRASTSHTPS
jgi:fatty acid desaturase